MPSCPPDHTVWHRAKPKQATLPVRLLSFPPNHSLWHCAIPTQADLPVCLLCFPPTHRVLQRAMRKQAEFADIASHPTIAFASRHTKAGKLASLPALLPPNHDVLHRAIPRQALIPTQPERLASALPKQANLRVCLLCFPPNLASPYIEAGKLINAGRLARLPALFSLNHSVLHRAMRKQANLGVCLHCFLPNHSARVASYQSRQTCEFACFGAAQP